ncbi:hypothetical protein, conserved [Eimeria brunetti]|uniref:RNase NYN domain-containing protein n=1 Tax=Eimeria brunetti TaxID=51314 RepID=U6LDI6_9EIME|nr:hypothetical protein, conserved [Eimeria brunetti]
MSTNSPSKWWWTWAGSGGFPPTWKLLEDSEIRLLEHAHCESWGRIEFYVDGELYAINEFSANARTHLAVSLEDRGRPKAFITRAVNAPTEGQCWPPAHDLEDNRPAHCPPVSLQDGAETKSKTLGQRGIRRALLSPDPATSPAMKPAKTGQVAVWRAFPKVDLEACDDHDVIRQILVDGVDIAFRHGGRRKLSPSGIAAAVAHFTELSFPVRVVVPQWIALMHKEHCNLFTESPEPLLEALREDDMLVVLPDPDGSSWYPSRAKLRADSGGT